METANNALIKLQRIQLDEQLRAKADKLKEKWEPRSKLESDQSLRRIAHFGKFFFSFISIALAFYLVQSVFFEAIPNLPLSVGLASLLLCFIEFLKHITLPSIIRKYLMYKKLSAGFSLFNLGLIAVSVFLSVEGIKKYNFEKLEIKPALLSLDSTHQIHETQINKVLQKYDNDIQQVENDKTKFIASISWKGKVNMYNDGNRKILEEYSEQLKALRASKEKAVSQLRKDKSSALAIVQNTNETRLAKASAKTEMNGSYLVSFALISEVGCTLCLLFLCLGDFQAFKETQELEKALTPSQKKKLNQSIKDDADSGSSSPSDQSKIQKRKKNKKYMYDKQIQNLFIEHRKNPTEIADLLGCSRNTVYNSLYRQGLRSKRVIKKTVQPMMQKAS